MLVDFEDPDLQHLFEDVDFRMPKFHPDIVRAYRKVVNLVIASETEIDLRGFRALRFEKLKGDRGGQHSMRLNDQWRLIVRSRQRQAGKVMVIVEITDYH